MTAPEDSSSHPARTDSPLLEHLRALTALTGPSGSEEDVIRALRDRARPLADEVTTDAFGNVLAVLQGTPGARRLLIASHMDEVGFRVRAVGADGMLRLEKVGGLDDRVFLAQRVWVRTDAGRLTGIIGTVSAHLLRDGDRGRVVPAGEFYVDVGARDRAGAEAMGVRVGDPVGFVGELTELGRGSGRYTAHAVDDRAGCALLLALLEHYRQTPPPVTLLLAFTVQEEVGLRGAQALARAQLADVALALDMTAADDTPELSGANAALRLGGGPTVKLMDNSTLAHPAVRRLLTRSAAAAGVAVQPEILRGIGTDAGALQYGAAETGAGGRPTGAVSVANRYTHSPVEVVDLSDLEGALQLLLAFAEALPGAPLGFLEEDE